MIVVEGEGDNIWDLDGGEEIRYRQIRLGAWLGVGSGCLGYTVEGIEEGGFIIRVVSYSITMAN